MAREQAMDLLGAAETRAPDQWGGILSGDRVKAEAEIWAAWVSVRRERVRGWGCGDDGMGGAICIGHNTSTDIDRKYLLTGNLRVSASALVALA